MDYSPNYSADVCLSDTVQTRTQEGAENLNNFCSRTVRVEFKISNADMS